MKSTISVRIGVLCLLVYGWINVTYAQNAKSDLNTVNSKISQAFKLRTSQLDSAFYYMTEANSMIESKKVDAAKGYYFQILSDLFKMRNAFSTADSLADLSIFYYKKYADRLGLSMAYLVKGNIFLGQSQLDSAQYYYMQSLHIKEQVKDIKGMAILHNNLGIVADYKGNYVVALDYYLKALKGYTIEKNDQMQADTYNNISIIHYNLGNIKEAIAYQHSAIEINKKINNVLSESMNYVCLASYYSEQNQLIEAEKYAKLAMDLTQKMQYHLGQLYSLAALGDVYARKGDNKQALEIFTLFLKLFKEGEDDVYMKSQVQEKIAKIYIHQKQFKASIPLLQQAQGVYMQVNNAKEMCDVTHELSLAYEGLGRHTEALTYQRQSEIWRDTVFSQDKVKQTLHLEAKYKSELQKSENARLKLEQSLREATINTQKRWLIIGGFGLVAIGLLSLMLYYQSQKRKSLNVQLSNQKDQIQLLNRELNHRVKNNLSFITSLLEMQSRRTTNDEIKDAIQESESRLRALSLVHNQLYKGDANSDINLAEYLTELIAHLQQIFDTTDKPLTFDTHIGAHTINAEDAMRIGLVVNELVTNSVKHAFANISQPTIVINTKILEDGRLALQYKDNGPGTVYHVNSPMQSQSLGLKLIELFRKQLDDKFVLMV